MRKKKKPGKDTRAEAAKRKQAELKEDLESQMEALGLEYHDDDIPPEEVDREEVAKPLLYTLKSLIPYTTEWYATNTAEDEMDDLRALQVETAKAKKIVTLTRIGRHEDALEIMMADTNHDFHYFNKMKAKATEEGKFVVDMKLVNRQPSRPVNALQAAHDAPLPIFGGDTTSSSKTFQLSVNMSGGPSDLCIWRGKDQTGLSLKCGNSAMTGLSYCTYHNLYCIGDHDGDKHVTIKFPNKESLCTNCYMTVHQQQPPKLAVARIPGVVNAATGKPLGGGAAEQRDVDDEAEQLCGWKPDAEEMLTEKRGYVCRSSCYRHPDTGVLLPLCAMHMKKCIKVHSGNDSTVAIPNIYGLCTMHHIAEYGDAPIEVPFPYPGMQRRLRDKGWKIKPGHFLAPTWPRKDDIVYRKEYVEPIKPKTFIEKIRIQAKLNEYKKRVKALGKLAATIIQRHYRGYLLRGCHRNLIFELNKNKRTKAAVVIQCLGRRYNSKKEYLAKREKEIAAVIIVQRVRRGFLGRRQVRRLKAAIFIQRAMKKLKAGRFQAAVMAVISIKRLIRKKAKAAVVVQRVVRGFVTRNSVVRYLKFLVQRNLQASKIVSRALRRYRDIMHRIRNPPKDLEGFRRFKLGLRIGYMLKRLYLQFVRRKEMVKLRNIKAVVLQKAIRRFNAQAVRVHIRFLREALQNWCKPEFAVEFLQEQMIKKVPMCKYGLPVVARAGKKSGSALTGSRMGSRGSSRGGSRVGRVDGPICVRAHLDVSDRPKRLLDKKVFEVALQEYYKINGFHFSLPEYEAIVKTFKDLTSGKINMVEFDSYVELHKQNGACTLHGRNICGACIFYKECGFRKCGCKHFQADTLGNALNCSSCHHSNVLHQMYPLNLKSSKRFKGLVTTLTSSKRPDMELPEHVIGVASNSMELLSKPKIEKRPGTGNSTKSHSTTYSEKVSAEQAELTSALATCQEVGSNMAQNAHTRDYWGQDELHFSINNSKGFELPGDRDIVVNADEAPPNTSLSPEEFWKAVMSNPNKSVRDYNEKFEHNMPMPMVTDGKLVYTIEGSKVYVMLLTRLIYLGERDFIHHDNGDLLRLIVDHMQLFERHWRKMVVDIRTGKLNRHVSVSVQDRHEFESNNLPRPKIAETLDNTFRKLGFHMKVLGKDITEKPFAEKKKPKNPPPTFEERGGIEESLQQLRLKSRRLSTPIESIEAMIVSDQRQHSVTTLGFSGTSSMGWEATRGNSREHTPSRGRVPSRERVSSQSELSLLRTISRSGKRPNSRDTSSRGSRREKTMEVIAAVNLDSSIKSKPPSPSKKVTFVGSGSFSKEGESEPFIMSLNSKTLSFRDKKADTDHSPAFTRSMSYESNAPTFSSASSMGNGNSMQPSLPSLAKTVGSEVLGKIIEFEESQKIRGPSRRNHRLNRRGSDTDILRPAVAEDLHDITHMLHTDARSKYDQLVKSGERFLCPFPSCGESFTSMQATFDHLKEHEQKTMLFGSAPSQDAHMRFYWPEGAPWRSPQFFNTKGIAAGSVGCSQCDEAFPTKDKLDIHVRLNHNKPPPKELPRHIECVGKPTKHVPSGVAFLDQCIRHLYFEKNCENCVRCELNEGVPKPKFTFYKSIRINFTVLKGSGGSTLITVGEASRGVVLSYLNNNMYSMDSASFSSDAGDSIKGSPQKKKPVGGLRGIVQGIVVDSDKTPWICINRLLTAKEARSENVPISRLFDYDHELLSVGLSNMWYKAEDIIDRFTICYDTKVEFKKKLKNGEIPSDNIYFVRTEDERS